jgi:DegV family protein with EDD domain
MSPERIAILVDSCTDVPQEIIDRTGIFSVPITIIYKDREYKDKVEISAQEVYDRLLTEVPRTSLPQTEDLMDAFQRIQDAGYTHVIALTISSALSGTNGVVNMVAEGFPGLTTQVIDTLSIGFGAGTHAVLAADLLARGKSFSRICDLVRESIKASKIYFCLSTLEYLARGGRIGKVSAVLGSLLHIKPIITCNEEGAYVIAAKVRGRAQAIAETIRLAVEEAKKHAQCAVAVIQGDAREEAVRVLEEVKRRITNCKNYIEGTVSPALVVHTGPGLIGISVQALSQQ